MKDNMSLKTNINLKFVDSQSKEVIDEIVIHNIITTAGRSRVANLIGGLSIVPFKYIAIGTGTTTEVIGDTALGTEVTRALASISESPSGTVKFEKTFSFGSGESYTITEIGLFDSITPAGSTILNRATFTGRSVDTNLDLIATVNVQVT